jgi:hypothetical protein
MIVVVNDTKNSKYFIWTILTYLIIIKIIAKLLI